MDFSLLLLIITAILGLALHISLFSNRLILLGYALMISLGAYMMFGFATEITLELFRNALKSPKVVKNITVFIVAEAFLLILAGWLKMKETISGNLLFKWKLLTFIPGLLWLPAVLMLQAFWLSSFPGQSFVQLQWASTFAFPLLIFGLAGLLKYALPEPEIRLELKYLNHLMQILLSGVFVAALSSFQKAPKGYEMELMPLMAMLVAALLLWLSGFVYYKFKRYGNRQ